MYIPKDIMNIIYDYKKQLELIYINKEIKEKVIYTYSSEYFSQLDFNNKIVSFYKGNYTLCKINNTNGMVNGIYYDTIITLLK